MDYWLDQVEPSTIFTGSLLVLITVLLIAWGESFLKTNKTSTDQLIYSLPYAPSPFRLPLIGHLYQLARYPTNPWLGFNDIQKQYGEVVRLQLGLFPTVMVSSLEAIREVLLVKGEMFSDRPHFDRHSLIFGSNRQNALALCDWTENHKARRSIAHAAIIPRFGTKCFIRLAECIEGNIERMMTRFQERSLTPHKPVIATKNDFVYLCCSIFVEFLLEKEVDLNDVNFKNVSRQYDFIFYDINQMYLCDFLPFLKMLTSRTYLKHVQTNARDLRNYVEQQISPRLEFIRKQQSLTADNEKVNGVNRKSIPDSLAEENSCEERFVDRLLLLKQYQSSAKFLDFILKHFLDNQKTMSWEECLYEIGDLVGGNSAVANLMVRLLGYLAINPNVQQQLYEEALSVARARGNDQQTKITLEDRPHMPLTNASIMETLRLSSSPIVPHLARVDTSIQGYFIPKGTMILFNIYNLNFNDNYWNEPYTFNPSRFVTSEGNVLKPEYFFPFSHGRRSCLGYKMVNTIIFATVANLLLKYKLVTIDKHNADTIEKLLHPKGTIALPLEDECYQLNLLPRNK